MTKLFASLLLITGLSLSFVAFSPAQEQDDRIRDEIKFDYYWEQYLLTKLGCPLPIPGVGATPLKPEDCVLPKRIDYAAYLRSEELALKVYPGLQRRPTK